jgi:hypothetical protein
MPRLPMRQRRSKACRLTLSLGPCSLIVHKASDSRHLRRLVRALCLEIWASLALKARLASTMTTASAALAIE